MPATRTRGTPYWQETVFSSATRRRTSSRSDSSIGSIHTFLPGEKSYHKTDVTTYDVSSIWAVALARFFTRKRRPEMTLSELRTSSRPADGNRQISDSELVELHRSFRYPSRSLYFRARWSSLGGSTCPCRAIAKLLRSLALILVYYLLLTRRAMREGRPAASSPLVDPHVVLEPSGWSLRRGCSESGRETPFASVLGTS